MDVLDFGSGTGANCPMFPASRYLGVDPDAARIAYAKRKYPQYSFHVLEPGHLPVKDHGVDCILIVSVLHHIGTEDIDAYMPEFRRVLKPGGTIIGMEPILCPRKPISNRFMQWYDNGRFIRCEEDYIKLFQNHGYSCTVQKRFRKCFLYNELLFSAALP